MKKPTAKKSGTSRAKSTPAPPSPATAVPTEDQIDGDVLMELRDAGTNGAFIAADQASVLAHFGFATVDMSKAAPDTGNVAAWITDAGSKYFAENYSEAGDDEGGETEATEFAVDTDVPMPTGRRGYTEPRGNKYPFATMPVGASFHIPKTVERPKPSVSFASSVTTANKRFAGNGMKFVMRAVGPDDPRGPGARVFRES